MNNVLSNMQMFETSENCDKFSKSVSYETLVAGTTTIGKGIKQNQRLSKGSANKPLSAVGTLTSLLCNSVKVVEKWLQTLPVFRLIKIFGLVAVLSVGTLSESSADNITSGTCGDDCTWSFSNGTLKIIGDIQDYEDGRDTPWIKAGLISNVKTIDASESTGFGTCSFENLEEVTKVIMPKQINGIPAETFRSCAKLENLEFPDGLQYIGGLALSQMNNLKGITIPDSATVIYSDIFEESSNINTIYCKGDISACRNNLANAGINYLTVLTAPEEQCQNSSNYYFTGTECTNRPENPDDITCVGGYAKLKNNCVDPLKTFAKKRWTPAEANEWLHDGNDNFVIITFKK